MIRLSAVVAIAVLLVACDTSSSSSSPQEPPPDDSTPAEAVPIALVATARCSAATATTFTTDSAVAESTTACLVVDGEGKIVPVTTVKVSIVVGGVTLEPPRVTPDVAGTPWQVGVTLSPEQRAQLVTITLEVASGDASKIVTTDNASYDWTTDPLFDELGKTTAAVLVLARPPSTLDARATIAPLRTAVQPHHVLVATDQLFTGDVTVAAADAACAQAGGPLFPGMRWQALLGSASAPVVERVRLSGPVLSYAGGVLANTPKEFWAGTWIDAPLYSATGANVLSAYLGPRDGFVTKAWLGDDAAASCTGWTVKTGAGKVLALAEQKIGVPSFLPLTRPCAERLRLACISRYDTIPAEAAYEQTVAFHFRAIGWRVDSWTNCTGTGSEETCELYSIIVSQFPELSTKVLDAGVACGKKLARSFTASWTEREGDAGHVAIVAQEAKTGASVRLRFDSTDPRWVCDPL